MRTLRWLVVAAAIAVFVGACGGGEIADVVDHATPEIDATRVAEISPSETIKVVVPSDTGVDHATQVATLYGEVTPQDASGLTESADDETSAVSAATQSVATDPSTGEVNRTIRDDVTICVKAGFMSVGKTYFEQWLNGQYSFNSLISSGIAGCLTKTFPDANPQVISQLSSELVATIDPSTARAEQNSPTVVVFQNWLMHAGS